jgi:hypothetical protein
MVSPNANNAENNASQCCGVTIIDFCRLCSPLAQSCACGPNFRLQ